MGETVVRAEGVRWAPGAVQLTHVDLEVTAGTATAVVGAHGAGKSLLLLLLSALAVPDAGRLQILGFDPTHSPRAVRERVGRVPAEPVTWGRVTCRDALRALDLGHGHAREGRAERVAGVLERVGLADQARTLVLDLPAGLQRRLGLAAALLHDPALLLLDDPLTGADDATREIVAAVVAERLAAGHTVILTADERTDLSGVATTEVRLDAGRTPGDAPRVVAPRPAPEEDR